MASEAESFLIDSVIRGYHVYNEVWLSFTGKILYCCHDQGSTKGLFDEATKQKRSLLIKRHKLKKS